jgi:CPA1 family monovalent cation:H+ antiporter
MLEIELFAVVGVIVIVLGSVFASRLGVAVPIIMVLLGTAGSFLPGMESFVVEPEIILAVVLPPILYGAAVNMPTTDFRRNFGSISALSVVLVLVSAFGAGALIYLAFPNLSFASAVAVGAVISPPDAVAATSIGKRLGLPPRLVTILEGEGLVNDATALVLLRSAIAAIGASFSLWDAVVDFGYAVIVAIIIGIVVGAVTTWIRSKIGQVQLTTAVSFVVPFLAYLPAEEFGASGVLAVVAAGLVTGALAPRRLTAEDRIAERTNWRTIQMLLENGVFLLMGLQLMSVIEGVEEAGLGVWGAVAIGAGATIALILLRVAFMVPLVYWLRRSQAKHEGRIDQYNRVLTKLDELDRPEHPRPKRVQRALRQRVADANFYVNEGLDWRGGAVLAWSGMRGVVTLAAAQSLPVDLPYRPQLILIAFTVAIITLIAQGGTLPLLIQLLGIRGTPAEELERERGRLMRELAAATDDMLASSELRRPDGGEFDAELVRRLRERNERMLAVAGEARQQVVELQRLIFTTEHAALQEARSSGTYRSSTIEYAQTRIDNGAMRLDGE